AVLEEREQEVADGLRLRHHLHRPEDGRQRRGRVEEVVREDDADDLVDVLAVDGEPREPRLDEPLPQGVEADRLLDGLDLGAGDHRVPDAERAVLEHVGEEPRPPPARGGAVAAGPAAPSLAWPPPDLPAPSPPEAGSRPPASRTTRSRSRRRNCRTLSAGSPKTRASAPDAHAAALTRGRNSQHASRSGSASANTTRSPGACRSAFGTST